MAPIGWECSRCTYRHHAPGNRCVMCNELRVTKEQMRDFIMGKTMASKTNEKKNNSITAQPPAAATKNLQQHQQKPSQSSIDEIAKPQENKNSTSLNPYSLKIAPSLSVQNQQPQQPLQRPPPSLRSSQYKNNSISVAPPPPQAQQRAAIDTADQRSNDYVSINSSGFTAPFVRHNQSTAINHHAAADPSRPPFNASTHPTTNRRSAAPRKQPKTIATNATTTTATNSTAAAAATAAVYKSKNPFTIAAQAKVRQIKKNPFALTTTRLPYTAGPVPLALHLAENWIYPTADEFPKRQYQFEISQSAVLQNTLVSLPTGLGKTLIAAVVLYNYYRWFPTGKVIFLAPTLPLVDQQVQACYDIMGISASDTALLTGKVPAQRRTTIWKQKRVFFCTPQTVQKDLENSRLDACQVVCVVLDEAHKATGDYAYCKVVELLEAAGAKFRILGLSATPGTSIKAIQQVVNVLRINCIEARSDTDPDVKLYIHERQTEVIIVKQVAASKVVERCLDEIIGPILDRLRRSGALPRTLTGNATVTSYCLLKAREEFGKRQDRDNSMIGFFAAGIAFIQIRSDLHKHGIGVVRNKLQKMRMERQIGHTATIAKSKAFQQLWEEVSNSSCDPDAVGNTVEDRLRNNPKLSKLKEILEEHFERARTCGASSRAIVFSQFRDSVSEIVDVLNTARPLIVARQFVGQGKSNKQTTNEGGGQSVKGMKQEEQKRVIQEFRDNVHNTLVCTSIGEEGLDIGSVDIILNFDCLSSPIRMLQRVGRTGRKRDGRVVSLVAEGPEERTLAKSRQNERNLVHALKNPKSFTVSHVVPMFPKDPSPCERNMAISQNFHMSQVDGAARTKGKRASSAGLQIQKKLLGSGGWKLLEAEESQRSRVLGQLKDMHTETLTSTSSAQLRRRFVVARALSLAQHDAKTHRQPILGRTSQLLRKIELAHAEKGNEMSSDTAARPTRNTRSGEAYLDLLFPLTVTKFDLAEDSALSPSDLEISFVPAALNTTRTTIDSSRPSIHIPLGSHKREGNFELPAADCQTSGTEPAEPPVARAPSFSIGSHVTNGIREPAIAASERLIPSVSNPYASRSCVDRQVQDQNGTGGSHENTKPDKANGLQIDTQSFGVPDEILNQIPSPTLMNNNPALPNEPEGSGQLRVGDDSQNLDTENGEFHLPSQDDSSSCSDSRVVESIGDFEIGQSKIAGASKNPPPLPAQREVNQVKSAGKEACSVEELAFRLPTQDSSSSGEESDDDDDDDDDDENTSLVALEAQGLFIKSDNNEEIESRKPAKNIARDSLNLSQRTSQPYSQRSSKNGQVRFSVETTATDPISIGGQIDAPDSEPLYRRKNSKKRVLAVLDTPDSQFDLPRDTSRPKQESPDDCLSNTQDDTENIVCAVCLGKESPEEDPIILCDGPGNGGFCEVAVHVSCYSAVVDLNGPHQEWRCDRCEFVRSQISGNYDKRESLQCLLCGLGNGALKRHGQHQWKHQNCKPGATQFKQIRRQAKPQMDTNPAARLALSNLPYYEDASNSDSAIKKRRKAMFRRFIDDEADADSDDDDVAEEADVLAMEEEELANGFINDSSQLGFTQDDLDRADPDTDTHGNKTHRALDLDRERKRQFATPALNRRVLQGQANSQWSEASASVPDSDRGLGKMHFIRSVLEHHRNGGRAEEIEQLYHQLQNDKE